MIVDPARDFVAFDLETTGLNPGLDRIVEVGAVRFAGDGTILATFQRLVNPLQASGPVARSIHGISDAELAEAATADLVLPAFLAFLGDPRSTQVLAHHSASDAGFLGSELLRAGLPLPPHPIIDTLAWARRCWPHFGNHRLDPLASRLSGDSGPTHRALADSLRVRAVFLALQRDDPTTDRLPLAYLVHDGAGPAPVPAGWEAVAAAIDRAAVLEIIYAGGSRGTKPRCIQPERFTHRGGVAYLAGVCHLDGKLKDFQVERIQSWRVVDVRPTGGKQSPTLKG